jgi:hypothetical protein
MIPSEKTAARPDRKRTPTFSCRDIISSLYYPRVVRVLVTCSSYLMEVGVNKMCRLFITEEMK